MGGAEAYFNEKIKIYKGDHMEKRIIFSNFGVFLRFFLIKLIFELVSE